MRFKPRKRDIFWQFLSVVIFTLGLSPSSYAADINEIVDMLKRGDFSKVESDLVPLAEAGDPRAQYNLGVSYSFGNGIAKDPQKAFFWTLMAANNGDQRAKVNVASMYMEGKGTPRNIPEAVRWYEKAAQDGDVNADMSLAKIYRDGIGGQVDFAKAFQHYSYAADKGNDEARYNLVAFYHYGLGVQRNEEKARAIFASLRPNKPDSLPAYDTAVKTR